MNSEAWTPSAIFSVQMGPHGMSASTERPTVASSSATPPASRSRTPTLPLRSMLPPLPESAKPPPAAGSTCCTQAPASLLSSAARSAWVELAPCWNRPMPSLPARLIPAVSSVASAPTANPKTWFLSEQVAWAQLLVSSTATSSIRIDPPDWKMPTPMFLATVPPLHTPLTACRTAPKPEKPVADTSDSATSLMSESTNPMAGNWFGSMGYLSANGSDTWPRSVTCPICRRCCPSAARPKPLLHETSTSSTRASPGPTTSTPTPRFTLTSMPAISVTAPGAVCSRSA